MAEKQYIVNELIPKFIGLVSADYDLNRIVLYGSYARGNASRTSDIDIAVILNTLGSEDRFSIIRKLYRIAGTLDKRIEPRCFLTDEAENAEYASILSEIIRTGESFK